MSLSLRGVVATAGAATILRGVDLDVPDGSAMAVLGPSGAGKTTLLRVIAGLQPTSDGTVSVDGSSINDVATQDRNLALVFQDARLFPSMDVAANVGFPLRMTAGRDGTSTVLVAEALACVGLDGFGPRKVRGLSGGEQQRVALARALVGSPRLLLLDEPFGAVDPDRRAELRSLVNRLRTERRMTTLLVTHDRDDAALVGDEIAI
ncbi:MAG: putative spermidine/putrescine transport system ATP-binding protein, partial [Glaciecola sp.]